MSKGVLLFAFNNGTTDYFKMAVATASRAYQFLNLQTTVVTDSNTIVENYFHTFENVIVVDSDNSNRGVDNHIWINKRRCIAGDRVGNGPTVRHLRELGDERRGTTHQRLSDGTLSQPVQSAASEESANQREQFELDSLGTNRFGLHLALREHKLGVAPSRANDIATEMPAKLFFAPLPNFYRLGVGDIVRAERPWAAEGILVPLRDRQQIHQ